MTSEAVLGLSDEEAVRRFQETGDREYFAGLFLRYRKKVFLACRGFFPDRESAEDITQETFLRALRNVADFREGDFSGWLMRIARNVCIDEWRKSHSRPRPEDIEMANVPDPAGLESTLEKRRLAAIVWQEIRFLSPAQGKCLELNIKGYSYEETALRTGLTTKDVKSHIQNGRRMLGKRMEGALPGWQ
jgi:RNA polymerase sigma-70 factor (ECF subfamily)